jgi:ABC-type multidrug transport system fused ATPase/permease subunit
MKLLLKAALYQKKYIPIVIASLISLMCLTLASSLEMLAVGILSGKGETLLALKTAQTSIESGFLSSLQEKISVIKQRLCSQQLTSSLYDWTFILSVLIAIIGFKALALFYSRFFTQILSVKISKDLRERYFQHLQKLPMQFYEKYNIGTLASRVGTDAAQIAISLNAFLTNYFHYILSPKSDWMLNHMNNQEEVKSWLLMYREMQYNYHMGLVLGIIAVGILAFAFRC